MSEFDVDLVTGPRRSARAAWIVAACSMVVTALLALVLIVMLPLKHTEVFTVLVDSTTGASERIYQVQPTGIADKEAIKESLLVAYITDRESYFRAGIQQRLESVQRRSRRSARRSLTDLWTPGNRDYPPSLYGANAELAVRVRSITFLQPHVAQIRFEKRLARPNRELVTQPFVATVAIEFEPRREQSLERVWENPLGFQVTSYRVDAETLGGNK